MILWTAYRKKEVQVEVKLRKEIPEPEPEPEPISMEESEKPEKNIKKFSSEIEKIGDRIVKVQFVEFTGKRKKKVTHIEVKEAKCFDSQIPSRISETINSLNCSLST